MMQSAETQYFSVQEVRKRLGWSEKTIRRLLKDDPDVQRLPGPGVFGGTAKRSYVTLMIPQSSINRVRERLTQPAPKPVQTVGRAPRPIRRIPRKIAA